MKKTRVAIMVFISFFFIGCFDSLSDTTSIPPIRAPIDLSKSGEKVEFDVKVDGKAKPYYV